MHSSLQFFLNGPQPDSHPSETLTILYETWAEAMQQGRADSAKARNEDVVIFYLSRRGVERRGGVYQSWGSSSNRVKIYSKPPPKRPLGVIFRPKTAKKAFQARMLREIPGHLKKGDACSPCGRDALHYSYLNISDLSIQNGGTSKCRKYPALESRKLRPTRGRLICYSFAVEDLYLCSLPISRRTNVHNIPFLEVSRFCGSPRRSRSSPSGASWRKAWRHSGSRSST
jgi:hypothetical protein